MNKLRCRWRGNGLQRPYVRQRRNEPCIRRLRGRRRGFGLADHWCDSATGSPASPRRRFHETLGEPCCRVHPAICGETVFRIKVDRMCSPRSGAGSSPQRSQAITVSGLFHLDASQATGISGRDSETRSTGWRSSVAAAAAFLTDGWRRGSTAESRPISESLLTLTRVPRFGETTSRGKRSAFLLTASTGTLVSAP
jgi:hypothetical protein